MNEPNSRAVGGPLDTTVRQTAEMTALEQFRTCEGHEIADPLERLRFFCSLAMSGQDWLDVEPFFDDVSALLPAA
jgi:hypothetical protein